MQLGPKVLSSKPVYSGKVFDIRVDEIREGDITYKTRDRRTQGRSAVVIPVFEDHTVALVRQYRHAAGKYLLEICAGTLNPGEDPKLGAIRELEEEVGVRAAKIEKISEFYVSPGFLTEKMFVFLATELTETQQNLEEDELLTIERHSFPSLFEMIRNGEIEDAKSIAGLTIAGARLGFPYA